MHESVMKFARDVVSRYVLYERAVLEVGSLDVNGSVRSLFTGSYLGSDMQDGPGVDVVINAHELNLGLTLLGVPRPRPFEVIVCTEMLEHDDLPWVSLSEMHFAARMGGYLILTCRGYDASGCFPVHGYPDDFYRFSPGGVRKLLDYTGWRPLEVVPDPDAPGVLAVARAM